MTGRTNLSDEEFAEAWAKVRVFLRTHAQTKNSSLRALTHLNYDQAIKFFNVAVSTGVLERRGRGSATHYVLPNHEPGPVVQPQRSSNSNDVGRGLPSTKARKVRA